MPAFASCLATVQFTLDFVSCNKSVWNVCMVMVWMISRSDCYLQDRGYRRRGRTLMVYDYTNHDQNMRPAQNYPMLNCYSWPGDGYHHFWTHRFQGR
ncbi:hypothetical protein BDZ91DRAFT_36799 [Kalaharituber pfeilii]|nr:hypothetical protein BDZ91DRAFT_36799 [Kalaharituber pfeilii]